MIIIISSIIDNNKKNKNKNNTVGFSISNCTYMKHDTYKFNYNLQIICAAHVRLVTMNFVLHSAFSPHKKKL